MNALNAALLVNLLGFSVGIALYALLGLMVLRHRAPRRVENADHLLLATATLGLLWNVGGLYLFIEQDLAAGTVSPFIIAISFSALGFLPSVVVHSAQAEERQHWLTFGAYALSTFAAVLHFHGAITGGPLPSDLALQTLTVGSLTLSIALLVFNFRQTLQKKAVLASALLVFAVSALHLSSDSEGSWYVELIAHQSSLPLALVILYQNYRFAFADLFLKRAVSLLLLAALAFGLYTIVAAPLLHYNQGSPRNDVESIGIVLALWIATALIYPLIHKFAAYVVDTVFLRRPSYEELQSDLAGDVSEIDGAEEILDLIAARLGAALTAHTHEWASDGTEPLLSLPAVSYTADEASILIPTTELPRYRLTLRDFFGGRRLLSDEIAFLESVSVIAARRIDGLRISQERYEHRFREQEMTKLATEAQLTALRSQINPHFLFNALTTIGYLITTSPEKAYDTLLRLTQLLRGVLKSTSEFSTVGDEVRLVESYLEVERARFEEKLRVRFDIQPEAENVKVPSLILQPLVENAIKHGISENRDGGEIRISAKVGDNGENKQLRLTVWDSGAGKRPTGAHSSPSVGLRNTRDRLASYYPGRANLELQVSSGNGRGTLAEITFSLN